jgi:anaerobic selenocysteine-containing dehydrogenase
MRHIQEEETIAVRTPANGACQKQGITRRIFLKSSAFVGGTALLAQVTQACSLLERASRGQLPPKEEYALAKAENILYSVCLNCHVRCPLKVKLWNGIAVKLDGNPYAAKTLLANLPYETSPQRAAKIDGHLCPKGQSGVQIAYDPYRLRKVLKRAGPRGANRWVSIDFNQAVEEIASGGDLFGEGPVPGLKEILKLDDAALAKTLAKDAAQVARDQMSVDEFKTKHSEHLDLLIDPDHPDLGPVNNGLVFMAGRIQHGRKELAKRFMLSSFGSVNFFEHTTICEQSHHIATKMMTRDPQIGKAEEHLKPDFLHAEFVIFWGTGAFEANFGSNAISQLVTNPLVAGTLKIAVVDPRFSKTAAKAWKWVPVKPGGDTALAMGMIRWIIENNRFNQRYLENPNQVAAEADGFPTWTDATQLVRTDTMTFLRAKDVPGLPDDERLVVMGSQGPRLAETAPSALLEFDDKVGDIPVKTVFTLLKERAFEKTLEEYAQLAGVSVQDIQELAHEYTDHGTKAAIDTYRGLVKHPFGYYAQQAVLTLALLIGSADFKGGLTVGGGHWHEDGSKKGQPFPKEILLAAPGGITSFGVPITREKHKYEGSSLFRQDGYPAKRPWYPFTSNVYQEIIPSAEDSYPYPIKALLIHMGTPALSTPGGGDFIRALRDPKIIPLLLACDVVIGETSRYADYIIPDLTYLERWGVPHDNPQPSVKSSQVRQPTIAPLTEIVTVDGEEMPISLEAFLIAVAKRLGRPGVGQGGFGNRGDFNRPEDFYLRMAANLAFGDQADGSDAVPQADEAGLALFRQARRHLPAVVFDEAKWKAAVGGDEGLWRRVVYLLSRGGRFQPFSSAYNGELMAHKFGKQFHLYIEAVARQRASLSGQNFDGLPRLEPVLDAAGKPVADDEGLYAFQLITFKEIFGSHSRTISAYWNQVAILPENRVLINSQDARRLGIKDGDRVKLVSASLTDGTVDLGDGQTAEVAGSAQLTEGIRPGVIAVSWHYGHWAYGSHDVEVDGQLIKGDSRRGTGLVPNPAMRLDPALKNVCLTDPIGGSASFFDTRVRLVKV